MNMFWIACASIACSVAAQFALKAGMSSPMVKAAISGPMEARTALTILGQPHVLAGFALYGLGALVWLLVLSRWDVSKAYPLVGMGFILTCLVGWWFGENITIQRVLGVAIISAGIVLVARS